MGRLIACMMRCGLMTGDYEGATRKCPCSCTAECKIDPVSRQHFMAHPKVSAARVRNHAEFKELNKHLLDTKTK